MPPEEQREKAEERLEKARSVFPIIFSNSSRRHLEGISKDGKIQGEGVLQFADADELIGCVRTRRLTRTEFERWKAHEGLVGKCWRTERSESCTQTSLHKWMIFRNARRGETEGASLQLRSEMLLEEGKDLLIGITFIRTHINGERTLVGNDIVLSACIDNGHCVFDWTEKVCLLRELPFGEPLYILDGMIDGIISLIACGMTRFAFRHSINHHQSFLGNGRLHACRFAHNGKGDGRQEGEN